MLALQVVVAVADAAEPLQLQSHLVVVAGAGTADAGSRGVTDAGGLADGSLHQGVAGNRGAGRKRAVVPGNGSRNGRTNGRGHGDILKIGR